MRDLVGEPKEITQSRQQQEILQDLLADLSQVNGTVRRIRIVVIGAVIAPKAIIRSNRQMHL